MPKYKFYPLLLLIFSIALSTSAQNKNFPPAVQQVKFSPDPRPSRIILTWEDNPATSATVTWRTSSLVTSAKAEIALADPSPYFNDYETDIPASTTTLSTPHGTYYYHKSQFKNLKPATQYLYRVGDGTYWSEWFQFKTAEKEEKPFRFIYLGDAQNKVYSHFSRVIRAAYAHAPDAAFVLHVGDLINHADNDYEWEEWFRAGSFIHATIPTIALPGNHEYNKNKQGFKESFSQYWQPQFNYHQNGPLDTLQDQAYFIDYQQIRLIVLNSNTYWEEQAQWLDQVLQNSKKRWNILAFHHPIRNAVVGRQNKEVVKYWQPIIEKHEVDIVLQGHDHTYARGFLDPEKKGAMYVVSIAGEKMYNLTEQKWMQRKAENTQLYQVIDISNNELTYKSYTPSGQKYDAFLLKKNKKGSNQLKELPADITGERRNSNTLVEK